MNYEEILDYIGLWKQHKIVGLSREDIKIKILLALVAIMKFEKLSDTKIDYVVNSLQDDVIKKWRGYFLMMGGTESVIESSGSYERFEQYCQSIVRDKRNRNIIQFLRIEEVVNAECNSLSTEA